MNADSGIRTSIVPTVLLTVVILALLLAHIAFPQAAIDTTSLGLVALLIALWFLPWVKTIVLPGGTKLEMRDVLPVKELVDTVRPPAEPSRRPVVPSSEAIAPDSAWQSFIDRDPNVALAGLRIELERRLATLALRHIPRKDAPFRGPTTMVRDLREKGILSNSESEALLQVIDVCNRAVHAQRILPGVAREIARLGQVMVEILDYKLGER